MSHLHLILGQKVKKAYIYASAIGVIIGLFLTILSVDIYQKLTSSVMKSPSDKSYLMVNKQVSLLNTLSLSDNSFNTKDISNLTNQPFIDDVGKVLTSSCRIWAFRDSEPLKFKTDIFFEALDQKFLDNVPREWRWKESSDFIPVMINTDFLNLYNFAFSKSQNLPQFTASTVGQFTVLVRLKGNFNLC